MPGLYIPRGLTDGSGMWPLDGIAAGWWPVAGVGAGLIIGSFLATLLRRWPAGRTLGGRSACDGCGRRLGVAELVPLLSYMVQRGRCRGCGTAIDWRHPATEAGCALVGGVALVIVPGVWGFASALLGWALLALLLLDVTHYWLPDRLTWPLLGLGLLLGPAPFAERVLAAAIAGGALLALSLAYRALRGRDGLGLGDVKLATALGAWLSPPLLAPLLLLAAALGLLMALGLRLRRGELAADMRLPFGACLAAAGFPLHLALAGGG